MVKEKVRKFLGKFFDESQVSDDANIFESGLVSSLFAMQLVSFLENEFDIEISNDELDMKNFRSVSAIVSLVDSKM